VALQEFEAAVTSGLSGPAVHFNMGVAAYRLGQYSRAEAAFKEVARTPAMAALAHYNLGLVALRRDDRRAAARWFSQASQESSDQRLRDLALARLEELPSQPPDVERNWAGYAAFGGGYDDNVALVSNADVLGVSGRGDSFTDLQLAISAPIDRAWQLDAGLVWVDYRELDTFDLLSVQGGGRYLFGSGEWKSDAGVQFAYTTLDGQGFENRQSLLLQSRRALSLEWQLHAEYRFSRLDGLNDFEGLSGYRHEVGARMGWTREPWRIGFDYRFDVNDYDDDALSTRRHELGAELQRSLPGDWSIALAAAGRHSRYDLESNGTEDRTELALEIAKVFGTRWRLITRYSYADNDADLPEFNYQRGRFSAGFEAAM
jgi:tetratricopeptide (TPR) repeat protein